MTDTQLIVKENHNLSELSTKVKRISERALQALEDGLSSKDEKVRIDCAKTLLKLDIDISKLINEDAMNRLLLTLRQNGNPPPKHTPRIDFDNIQDV